MKNRIPARNAGAADLTILMIFLCKTAKHHLPLITMPLSRKSFRLS